MERSPFQPPAPSGKPAPTDGSIFGTARTGSIAFSDDMHSAQWATPEPSATPRPQFASGYFGRSAPTAAGYSLPLRILLALALLMVVSGMLSRALAELPALPQASLVPRQQAVEAAEPWQYGDYTVESLAQYDVTARVLSTRAYEEGRESDVSPIDFALGWGPMADRSMLEKLSVTQDNRWYFVRWRNAPVNKNQVIANSANTHLLPASPEVARQLAEVQPGDLVRLRGHLVSVSAEDGWRWNSSLVRTDTGDGSCEVLWVESVEIHPDGPIAYAQLN